MLRIKQGNIRFMYSSNTVTLKIQFILRNSIMNMIIYIFHTYSIYLFVGLYPAFIVFTNNS